MKTILGIILGSYLSISSQTLADVDIPTQIPLEAPKLPVTEVLNKKAILTPQQEEWLLKLRNCESSGNDEAINPNDLDNTPSYGRYQFKPSTFEFFSKKYKLGYEAYEYMQGDKQEEIVKRMILDTNVKIEIQFPDCVKRKIGYPPK
jgi:hypothetical protein